MKLPIAMIAAISGLVAGCVTTSTSTKPATTPAVVTAPVVIEPKWVPLTEGAKLSFDENYKYHPGEMKLSNERLLRGGDWNGYLKAYVESSRRKSEGQFLRVLQGT